MNIVWFSEIKWDYLKTRKQQIIRKKPSDVNLLYLEPYVKGRVNRYGLRREGEIFCATVPFVKAVPGGPVRWLLDRERVRDTIDGYARGRVGRLFREAGFAPVNTGKIVSNVYAIRVASRIPGKFLLYDCNDAHSAFPGMPPWTKRYYEASCRRADAVFASSGALLEDVMAVRGGESGCELIGNGVEYEHFQRARDRLGWSEPPDPPRIGYLGAVAPWFNFEFVERLALAHPDWEIAIVGPVILGVEGEVGRLTRLPNVSTHDAVDYEEVPDVLGTFTAGIIPFRYNALTRGVNPNKMYEYLAMGLPVVATRFSREVSRYPDVVGTSETAEEFVRACEATVYLASNGFRLAAHRDRAVQIAAENDWAAIAGRFWERVETLANAGG
jgi:glycosyltransferase involved in cell wall biosynthesis